MAERKVWAQIELTCKPLDSLEEIESFLQNPPPWRTLCNDLVPHSDSVVKNIDINPFFGENLLETPQTFCHYDPEAEEIERVDGRDLPKTLVCHDMANGYHDDSFIDGTGNYSAYTFYNWGGIDIFCYFSHHFITIPPLGWINVAHAHGVKVIGTVITEWADGVDMWERLLSSETKWQEFASMLVAIAKTLKFDGWLLNIENKVSAPQSLLSLVRHLHAALHRELPHAVLLWYDSVTIDGHLNWQNALNEKNRAFFEATDGLFTNYSWRVADVASSARAAGERLTDLFVGIDVWGRNFYGGGQFNTQQAIQLAYSHGCSLAIFAPGWTHESLSNEPDNINWVSDGESLDAYERFLLRDRALWNSIWPFLNTRLPCRLPFQTSFCRGQGKRRRIYGEVICPVPWYNLRHMQYQPNSDLGPHGYLLATKDNIDQLSNLGVLKNKRGILRYRRSLEQSKMGLETNSIVAMNIKADSLTVIHQAESPGAPDEESSEHASVRRKMKNALRNLFRIKASKTESEAGETSSDPGEASMVRVSVNLRLNRAAPPRYCLGYVSSEFECLERCYDDSFSGGSCLRVNPSDDDYEEQRTARLLHCDFECRDALAAVVVSKATPDAPDQTLHLRLSVADCGPCARVVLVGRDVPRTAPEAPGADVLHVFPVNARDDFPALQKYLVLNQPGFYVPVANDYGWRVRYYVLSLPGCRVSAVSCRTGAARGSILLGHFGLCSLDGDYASETEMDKVNNDR